jgi:ubiquinone/menaquinone biosynthesis C-methylase UbiE
VNKLHDIFACPVCKSKLIEQYCAACNILFPKDVVSSFICKEMYPSEQSYIEAKQVIDFWGNGWRKRLEEPEHKFLYALDSNGLKDYADQSLAICKSSKSLMAEVPVLSLSGSVVLNIGCGAGTEAVILARGGAFCIAMDITSPAASASDSLLRKLGCGMGIQGDARFIPLESESVDIVYSSGVLHHSTDLPKSIAEILRVLKPGGIAYIMLYATWSITFLQEKIFQWAGEKAWNTEGRRNPCTTTYSVAQCKELFSEFESVSISKQNASLRNFAKIGKFLPTVFDEYINEPLGANLNIVAKKSNLS